MDNLENQNSSYVDQTSQCPVTGWSFGAFMLSYIWGIGNKTYQVFIGIGIWLACFIIGAMLDSSIFMFLTSIANFAWFIVCGVCGHKWAWNNAIKKNLYTDVREFEAVQKSWDRAGFVWFIIFIVLMALFFIFGLLLADSMAFDMSISA